MHSVKRLFDQPLTLKRDYIPKKMQKVNAWLQSGISRTAALARQYKLHDLVHSSNSSCDEEHHQRVETTFLAVLIRLRRSGYLVQEDIQQYELVREMCRKMYISEQQRFLFLTRRVAYLCIGLQLIFDHFALWLILLSATIQDGEESMHYFRSMVMVTHHSTWRVAR